MTVQRTDEIDAYLHLAVRHRKLAVDARDIAGEADLDADYYEERAKDEETHWYGLPWLRSYRD